MNRHPIQYLACIGAVLIISGCNSSSDGNGSSWTPTPPEAIQATPGSNQISLGFAAPQAPAGQTPSYQGICTSGSLTFTAESPQSPVLVQGLTNGVSYQCHLVTLSGEQTSAASATVAATPQDPTADGSFHGNILLGSPTDQTMRLNVLSMDQTGSFHLEYGPRPGPLTGSTAQQRLEADSPVTVDLAGLQADTQYAYRLVLQPDDVPGTTIITENFTFRTARGTGTPFSFVIQADPHLDEVSDYDLYKQTLANELADAPDFLIDLGDTFMTEKHTAAFLALVQSASNAATVNARYAFERGNFGRISHSVPLYLVNGNHDGELGWLRTDLPTWTTQARQRYFLNPTPNNFYSGDNMAVPYVGERGAWYSWQWGDAQFVVLDPYWDSTISSGRDGWNLTLGKRQYDWLKATLAGSSARYKFVFIHNLVGGLDGQMRGGVEAAPYFEWGGYNSDGTTYGFDTRRPGWGQPIHAILVANHVTAVFHGHDHLYARQELDGITYLEVPQPSANNLANGLNLAQDYHYSTANSVICSSSGHVRVTVSPSGVTSEYVRAWLPKYGTRGTGSCNSVPTANQIIGDVWHAGP